MDIVSQMYSGPLVQYEGSRQFGGGPFMDNVKKFAIPILRNIKQKLQDVSEETYQKASDDIAPKIERKRKHKKSRKSNKRARINELLGNDSY